MPDAILSRLSSIRIKIRRLTKSPSEAQLTDADIDSYINSFILYDMPSSVSLNSLKTVLRFYTEPYVDSYSTNTDDVDNPLYHFKDNYTLASNTVYISGNLSYWTDSRADFYKQYPRSVAQKSIGTGTDAITNYTGILSFTASTQSTIIGTTDGAGALTANATGTVFRIGQGFSIGAELFEVVALGTPGVMTTTGAATVHTFDTTTGQAVFANAAINTSCYFYPHGFGGIVGLIYSPVLPNTIIFASKDLVVNYIKLYDDGDGNLIGDGDGNINYETGVYDITFNTAPGSGEDVYSRYASYKAAAPTTVLFYENTFHLRPVPDKAYTVEVEVFKRPTELLLAADLPDLYQWWEYISFGAARKLLIDRSDFEGASLLEIEMEKKREEVLYKTVIQNSIKEGYGL